MLVPANFSESLSDLYGKPYRLSASGEAYDCWTLIVEIYKRLGINVVDKVDYQSSFGSTARSFAKAGTWERIDKPERGCLVLLYNNGSTCHVGFCIKSNKIFHALANKGVRMDNLKMIERIFTSAEYYLPCQN